MSRGGTIGRRACCLLTASLGKPHATPLSRPKVAYL